MFNPITYIFPAHGDRCWVHISVSATFIFCLVSSVALNHIWSISIQSWGSTNFFIQKMKNAARCFVTLFNFLKFQINGEWQQKRKPLTDNSKRRFESFEKHLNLWLRSTRRVVGELKNKTPTEKPKHDKPFSISFVCFPYPTTPVKFQLGIRATLSHDVNFI